MKIEFLDGWKPPTANIVHTPASGFPTHSFRGLLGTVTAALLLTACGSSTFSDDEPQIGAIAADIEQVANPPASEAKFSMGSNEFLLTGSLPNVEVVQQARSEIYIHE